PLLPDIHEPCRGLGLPALLRSYELGQPFGDPLPGPVPRPLEVLPVGGVPVRVLLRQRPPLAARRHHVEDGIHDPPSIDRSGAPHVTGTTHRTSEIGDVGPLL